MLSVEHTRVPMRLVGGFEAAIELPPNMTDAAWRHMLRYLGVMKDAYLAEVPLPDVATPPEPSTSLSDDAETLIKQVEDGGIPVYITAQFRQVAEQNGIEITDDMTPNDVIDRLKEMR